MWEVKKRVPLVSFKNNFVSERRGVFLKCIGNRKATCLLFELYIYEIHQMRLAN